MTEENRRRGRPATLAEEDCQAQLRAGQTAHRDRATRAGKVRLEAVVSAGTKERMEAYQAEHGLPGHGETLDRIIHEYMLTGKQK